MRPLTSLLARLNVLIILYFLFLVTTAVFSTCGMNIWIFMAAAFLSLPKQFITVYLGVALEDSEDGTCFTTTVHHLES